MDLTLDKNNASCKGFLPSPLWRRFCAIVYDTLLLVCIVFIAWQPVPLLPDDLPDLLSRAIRLSYLLSICFVFFGWFWSHGGQTLGMRAWKIKLVNMSGSENIPVSWKSAWMRFIMAMFSWLCLGVGFWSALFNAERLAWHDQFSKTRVILIRRNQAPVSDALV